MVNTQPRLVKRLNGIVRDPASVFRCCRRDRVAYRSAADERDPGPMALDDGGLSRFGEIAAAATVHDASLIKDVQTTQKRI